jgi:hypothetical protein
MSERKKSPAERLAEVWDQGDPDPGRGMRAYNQAMAQAESERRAFPPANVSAQPPLQRLHAWRVDGYRRAPAPGGEMGRITGVKIVCERCGDERVLEMPAGLCPAQ